MNNPKEKAKELIDKMYASISTGSLDAAKFYAKQCALICVDEILKALNIQIDEMEDEFEVDALLSFERQEWNEVKQEINKTN